MLIVQVAGGLGNQLFQYTFAKYLEKKCGGKCLLETNFFSNVENATGYTKRVFELDNLNACYTLLTGAYKCSNIITENTFYESEQFSPKDLTMFMGYWQNKKFFEEVKEEVRLELSLRKECITPEMLNTVSEMKSENSVSVHVRRGDYMNKENKDLFYELSSTYYEKALNIVEEETGAPLWVYLFSDDMDYVRSDFGFLRNYNCKYVPPGEAGHDLFLMSKTRNHINANSTYSWWGAALSDSDGVTVSPANWFKRMDKPKLDFEDWIVI